MRRRDSKMPRHPRVITWRLVVVSLVVGVVLAVGSVPVGVFVTDLPWATTTFTNRVDWYVYDAKMLVHRQSQAATFDSWSWTIEPDGLHSGWSPPADFSTPIWVDVDPRPERAASWLDAKGGGVFTVTAGWPMRAAYGELRTSDAWLDGSRASSEQVDVGIWYPRVFGRYFNLPYLPLWVGLLGNALFYVLVVLVPVVLLRWHKLRRRARRGLCLACAYELGEGVEACPECGLAKSRA